MDQDQSSQSQADEQYDSSEEVTEQLDNSLRPAHKAPRSCLICHRRKIKCDREFPCSNCSRGDVLCVYPGPERPARKPPRTKIGEVMNRLARLERTVSALSQRSLAGEDGEAFKSEKAMPSAPTDTDVGIPATPEPTGEVLFKDEYGGTYMNNTLLTRIMEEVSKSYDNRANVIGEYITLRRNVGIDIMK